MTQEINRMTDAQKLEALAEWIDWQHPNDPDPEVQHDLRAIAQYIRKVDAEIAALKEENVELNKLYAYDMEKAYKRIKELERWYEAAGNAIMRLNGRIMPTDYQQSKP